MNLDYGSCKPPAEDYSGAPDPVPSSLSSYHLCLRMLLSVKAGKHTLDLPT